MKKAMRNKIRKIIKKHYGDNNSSVLDWAHCGDEIYKLIDAEQDKVTGDCYTDICNKKDIINREIEGEYESFFRVGSMYAWVKGNDKLKALLNE